MYYKHLAHITWPVGTLNVENMKLYKAQSNDVEINSGDKQKTERVIWLSSRHGGIRVESGDNWSQTTLH